MRTAHRLATLALALVFMILLVILWDQKQRIGHDFNLAFGCLADLSGQDVLAQEEIAALRNRIERLERPGTWQRHADGRWWGFFIGDRQLGGFDSRTCTWRRYDEITDTWGKPERLQEDAPAFMEYEP